MNIDLQKAVRRSLKLALRPFLRWKALEEPVEGYSIVLGVPWALRHLLTVNLEFLSRADLSGVDRVFIVFDRTKRPGGDEFIGEIRAAFPGLPLDLRFQPRLAGGIVARIHRSKFYASLNWVTGLAACRTRYAILHDFDLYPLDPAYFERIHRALRDGNLRFSGAEFTHFDGLKDADRLVGTWALGIDVEWIRREYRPIECFHDVMEVNGRRVDLDAFSAIQSRTPERELAPGAGAEAFVHVRNLVSTFLLFSEGRPARIAWRLHHLWYLENLARPPRDLGAISTAMEQATGPEIEVDGRRVSLAGVHHTCANVLEKELRRTEDFLFGGIRPEVRRYLDAFRAYLLRIRPESAPEGVEASEA